VHVGWNWPTKCEWENRKPDVQSVMFICFSPLLCAYHERGGAGGAATARRWHFPRWQSRRCRKAPTPPLPPGHVILRLFSLWSDFGGAAVINERPAPAPDPARVISLHARVRRPDLIVLGTHQRTGMDRRDGRDSIELW